VREKKKESSREEKEGREKREELDRLLLRGTGKKRGTTGEKGGKSSVPFAPAIPLAGERQS